MKTLIRGIAVLGMGIGLLACDKHYYTSTTSTNTNADYTTFGAKSCDQVMTGTLAGVTLAPGTYCFDDAATLTGTLTLDGTTNPNGPWLFRIGTKGTGAVTGTNFNVVMANGGNPCGVTWRVTDAVTFTDSNIIGSILSGKAITLTRGTLQGQLWSLLGVNSITVTGTTTMSCTPQIQPLHGV